MMPLFKGKRAASARAAGKGSGVLRHPWATGEEGPEGPVI
jgi:hypothetical protein